MVRDWTLYCCHVFNSLRPSDAYMRRESNHHWFRLWLVAWTAPSHYLNQCWNIGPLGTNFNEISIGIQTFSFKKMHFKMSSAKWRPFCLGLNVLSTIMIQCDHHRRSLWLLSDVYVFVCLCLCLCLCLSLYLLLWSYCSQTWTGLGSQQFMYVPSAQRWWLETPLNHFLLG